MGKQLVIAGAWLVLAGFFLLLNMKLSRYHSVFKNISFYSIFVSVVIAVVILIRVSLEYGNG